MWTIEKLQSFIDDEIEENIHLDYKAADALQKVDLKKKEISKDVSAFANSDGGIVIYGMSEYKKDTRFLADKFDPVNRNDFSKETLEQVINSNINPRVPGIVITPVTIGLATDNKVIYIVEIPKSDTAHQANDKRYYKRFNFLSEMMEDWEIKDVINRKHNSDVFIWFEPILSKVHYERFSKEPKYKLHYDLWMKNIGNRSAEYIEIFIVGDLNDSIYFEEPKPTKFDTTFEIVFNNLKDHKITIDGDEFIVNSQHIPLLPKVSRHISSITIKSEFVISNKLIELLISTEGGRKRLEKPINDLVLYAK